MNKNKLVISDSEYLSLLTQAQNNGNFKLKLDHIQHFFQSYRGISLRFEYSIIPTTAEIQNEIQDLRQQFMAKADNQEKWLSIYLYKNIMIYIFVDGHFKCYDLDFIWFSNLEQLETQIKHYYDSDFNYLVVMPFTQRGKGYYTPSEIAMYKSRIKESTVSTRLKRLDDNIAYMKEVSDLVDQIDQIKEYEPLEYDIKHTIALKIMELKYKKPLTNKPIASECIEDIMKQLNIQIR